MCTDIILYRSNTQYEFLDSITGSLSVNHNGLIAQQQKLPEILFITSFPPRECGIATYSQDLVKALNEQFENSFQCSICALESDSEKHSYAPTPKFILDTDERNAFAKMAFKINGDENIKLVVMQHEFGFFATKETEFKLLFNTISKPVAFVFHTVLPSPNAELKEKVQEMSAIASSVIVMTTHSATILINDYGIPDYKITVIPHGTHLVPPLDRNKVKEQYRLSNRTVLSTFGLLSSSKSIETTLKALPAVIKKHPDVLFLVLGKTHPSIIKNEGEQYRLMLENIVSELNLEKHVRFVNEYLQLPALLEYLQLTDIYLFTSKDPHQAVSGTFSYAVSCGCPVISTPIPHAKEVLGNNNGVIVDFENSAQLADAITSLLDNMALRAEISSKSFHTMASTAWQNAAIAHALHFKELTAGAIELNYSVPKINVEHIKKMTTRLGMIQFSKIAIPDLDSGYTLDDNARAMIAICQHYELHSDAYDLYLIKTYLNFIKQCLQPIGIFLNYVDAEGRFTAQNASENIEDSNGRAIWALGYVVSLKEILPINLTQVAENLLHRALPKLDLIHSTRAMAFVIKGLHYQNKKENLHLLKKFADRLVQMYKHEKSNTWHWFEAYLTYGNSLLSEALLCAYLSTKIPIYKWVARESFEFLLSKIYVNGKIKVVSNKGWLLRDEVIKDNTGGEQPIDVAYTILALEQFHAVFKKDHYKRKMRVAFNWFLGENHLHQIVYNPCTGGCYDGVEEFNVNLNQGAESTISYMMARLAMERVFALENFPKYRDFGVLQSKTQQKTESLLLQ